MDDGFDGGDMDFSGDTGGGYDVDAGGDFAENGEVDISGGLTGEQEFNPGSDLAESEGVPDAGLDADAGFDAEDAQSGDWGDDLNGGGGDAENGWEADADFDMGEDLNGGGMGGETLENVDSEAHGEAQEEIEEEIPGDEADTEATETAETADNPDSQDTPDSGESGTSGLHEDLNNPDLFTENPEGEYEYTQDEHGKGARGNLTLSDDPQRNPRAQLAAGGDDREEYDDGGHLIGARFGGSPEAENLDAQNRDVNRRGFKGVENEWAGDLKDGDKVFVNVENYGSEGSERPDATMGYSITEDAEGNRNWDAFSFQNASYAEQEAWNQTLNEADEGGPYPNPMRDAENFDEEAYNEAMNEDTKTKRKS